MDLFLCLSSFLITLLLLVEKEATNTISIGKFYARRALRIWPLYYAMILIDWLMCHQTFGGVDPQTLDSIQQYIPSYLIFLGNYKIGMMGTYPPSPRLGLLWIVCLEEQFYLIWPLVLTLIMKYKDKAILSQQTRSLWVLVGVLLIFTMGCRLAILSCGIGHPMIWTNTFCRLDPLVLGALGAFMIRNPKSWIFKVPTAFLFILSGGLLLAVIQGPNIQENSFHIVWQLTALAIAFLLIILTVASKKSSLLTAFLSMRVTCWLGKISYGLYVFHVMGIAWGQQALAVLLPHLAHLSWFFQGLSGLLITVLLATLSYYCFERPFLSWKNRFTIVKSRGF